MAQIDSQLPVRSVADGTDERVHVKQVDYQDPNGSRKQQKISEDSTWVKTHGDYDGTENVDPSNVGLILHDRAATAAEPTEASQNKRPTAVPYDDGSKTIVAMDVALRDEDGIPFSKDNPVPVSIEESEGDEIHVFSPSAAAVAKDAVDVVEYTVTAGKEFELEQWGITGSGFMEGVLETETGVATGIFTVRDVLYNSTAQANPSREFKRPIKVAAGIKVRVSRTNLDNQSQTLNSFINGLES